MYERILVPIDGSPTAALGLAEAVKLAQLTRARLRLLYAVDMLSLALTPDAAVLSGASVFALLREAGEEILAHARSTVEHARVPVDTVLVDTLAARVCDLVVDEARRWGADLIVIGTHGRRGVSRLVMGSDAEQILRLAPVPVLLVRAPPSDGAAA